MNKTLIVDIIFGILIDNSSTITNENRGRLGKTRPSDIAAGAHFHGRRGS